MNQPDRPHIARKRFGQHFLKDQRVLDRIASAFAPRDDQNLVEIGPGTGALTHLLLNQIEFLTAIELDRDLASRLEQRYSSDRLIVHQMDILDCDLGTLHRRFETRKLRLIGNLPYNISTPLIFHLISQLDQIEDMLFMVQREVALRLAALPGSKQYGRLSVMAALALNTELLFDVPPAAFDPPPRVESSVVRLSPLPDRLDSGSADTVGRVVSAAFGQRRKTLRNSLSAIAGPGVFTAADIDSSLRAEALTPQQFVQLARSLVDS